MPIRDRIADVGMFASSGWICCENTSLVSQVGCVDASHEQRAFVQVSRLRNISLLPRLDRVRTSGFSRPEVRVRTWGFLIATSLKWAEQISTSESEAWKADLNAIWPICHEDGPQGAGIVSGLPTSSSTRGAPARAARDKVFLLVEH